MSDGQTSELKTLTPNHSCCGVNKSGNNNAPSKWVTMLVVRDVRENPNITPKQIINLVVKKFSVTFPYGRTWRAKEKAKELIFENVEKSYSYVPALKMN